MENCWPPPALWLSCVAVRFLSHFPSLPPTLLHCKLTKPLLTLVFSKLLLIHVVVSWIFPTSSVFHKVGFPRLKTAAPAKALRQQHNHHYVLQRSKWKTLARKLLVHPGWARALAASSNRSLPEIAHFHLEPSKDSHLTSSQLLESCFRISCSDTDILRISSSSVFIGSLNPFLCLFIYFPIAAQHPLIPSLLLLFPLNLLCGSLCSCALMSLFHFQYFALLLAQFCLEDFRTLFLVIKRILNYKPVFQMSCKLCQLGFIQTS